VSPAAATGARSWVPAKFHFGGSAVEERPRLAGGELGVERDRAGEAALGGEHVQRPEPSECDREVEPADRVTGVGADRAAQRVDGRAGVALAQEQHPEVVGRRELGRVSLQRRAVVGDRESVVPESRLGIGFGPPEDRVARVVADRLLCERRRGPRIAAGELGDGEVVVEDRRRNRATPHRRRAVEVRPARRIGGDGVALGRLGRSVGVEQRVARRLFGVRGVDRAVAVRSRLRLGLDRDRVGAREDRLRLGLTTGVGERRALVEQRRRLGVRPGAGGVADLVDGDGEIARRLVVAAAQEGDLALSQRRQGARRGHRRPLGGSRRRMTVVAGVAP